MKNALFFLVLVPYSIAYSVQSVSWQETTIVINTNLASNRFSGSKNATLNVFSTSPYQVNISTDSARSGWVANETLVIDYNGLVKTLINNNIASSANNVLNGSNTGGATIPFTLKFEYDGPFGEASNTAKTATIVATILSPS